MPETYTPEDLARVRAEIRARRRERIRQRIRGIRQADRLMPPRQIAALAGVSTAYVEEVLGGTSPPEGIILG